MTRQYIQTYGVPGQELVIELLAMIYVILIKVNYKDAKVEVGDVLPFVAKRDKEAKKQRSALQRFSFIKDAIRNKMKDKGDG